MRRIKFYTNYPKERKIKKIQSMLFMSLYIYLCVCLCRFDKDNDVHYI